MELLSIEREMEGLKEIINIPKKTKKRVMEFLRKNPV